MKFSFSSIGRNLLAKLPTITFMVFIILGTPHFAHMPAHEAKPVTPVADGVEWTSGYKGEVPVEIILGDGDLIDTVQLGENDETKAYIKKIIREGLLDQWDGMTLVEVEQAVVDAVSGATFSSNAIIANVRAEAARMANIDPTVQSQCTTDWWIKQIAAWMVLALAVVCYLFPAKTQKWRWVLLVATIGVLGFWQGTFLSMQMLYNYVINGSSLLQITLSVILVLAIAAPLLFNKSFYCQYVCPFGMLQEAVSKVPVRKIKLSPRVLKVFSWTRRLSFVAFVVLLWANPLFAADEWEPFSSFIIVRDITNFAAVSVLIIAGVSVIASMFMAKAWCRTLCPVGEFFSILQRKPDYKLGRKK